MAAVRPERYTCDDPLRHAGRARADDPQADHRARTRSPGAGRTAPVQLVSGRFAWNMAAPPGRRRERRQRRSRSRRRSRNGSWRFGRRRRASSRPRWPTTPRRSRPAAGPRCRFTVGGKHRYVGHDQRAEPGRARPAPGLTTPCSATRWSRRSSPTTAISAASCSRAASQRSQGGHPVLDLSVTAVTANPTVDLAVPDAVRSFTPPAGAHQSENARAAGVLHHRRDPITASLSSRPITSSSSKAPQTEERSLAVIAKVKETDPGKPIRSLVNTHVHFDHSGGLRTYVDEGATIVTHEANQAVLRDRRGRRRTPSIPTASRSRRRPRRSRPSPTSSC